MNTKERIMLESLRLFARRGYEAVSVADITEIVGITKGALYKHYQSKRNILDSIIAKMRENDLERAKQYAVPEELFENAQNQYAQTTLKDMAGFLEAQFVYWTENEFAAKFRQLLTIEQYVNEEMQQLYHDYLAGGVVAYIEDFFAEKQRIGELNMVNPKALAAEFYAQAFLLLNLYDTAANPGELKGLLHEQLEAFLQTYANC